MSTILFRTCAGANIGLGHLARCRALAKILNLKGYSCAIIGPALIYRQPADKYIFVEWIPLSESELFNNDPHLLIQFCKENNSKFVVLDDYSIDEKYQLILKNAEIRWLQFAGKAVIPIWTDIFVNASPSASLKDYESLTRKKNVRFLLGPAYAPLRPEFAFESFVNCKPKVDRILVTFGGGNDCGAIKLVLSCLLFLISNGIKFVVISGASNPSNLDLKKWIELSRLENAIELYVNPSNIPELYRSCDMAIMASGTSSYEALCCGLPTILLPIAENQILCAEGWSNLSAAINLGHLTSFKCANLINSVNSIISNFDERKRLSNLGRTLCDGLGASRIASVIESDLNNEFS